MQGEGGGKEEKSRVERERESTIEGQITQRDPHDGIKARMEKKKVQRKRQLRDA